MVWRNVLLSLMALWTAGCGSSDDGVLDDAAIMEAAAVTASEATASGNAGPSKGRTAASSSPRRTARFDPPFPERSSLFEPPRGGQNVVRRDDEHGESVELKGFIDVDGPQVVLAIDGVLSPIPEGGEKYGVQVISINPPQVVLQRGRSRWTASLE
jgi:hypothetical protein